MRLQHCHGPASDQAEQNLASLAASRAPDCARCVADAQDPTIYSRIYWRIAIFFYVPDVERKRHRRRCTPSFLLHGRIYAIKIPFYDDRIR